MDDIKIYTGYFAYMKRYIEAGLLPISIARYNPKWFEGISCTELAPKKTTLWRYKEGKIDEEQYTKEYLESLNTLNLQRIDKSFIFQHVEKARSLGLNGIIYLCYEKNGDFCHRHIFADYVNSKNKLNIKEFRI